MAFRKSDQGRLSVSADLKWPVGVTPPPEFQTAVDFARDDEGHLFVTGRAGTGKSTLLRAMREMITQEAVVLAPTGLAAVNVGGQTIHSFFGFPPRLIRPDDIRRSRNGRLMRKLKAIIIDEVSMVRSDLMWAIDQSLRMNRGRPREAFGGVRLILFGDLHQLPPVVQGAEVAEHLESAHGGPFFFQVPALMEGAGVSLIELERVFRQSDETLLRVLNRVRDGEATEEDLAVLNERAHAIRTLGEGDAYVILTPTNAAAQRINMAYLEALPGNVTTYEAGISGEFGDSAHPTDATLLLKVGAKAILLRNDPDRRWVNGSIARVRAAGEVARVDRDRRQGARDRTRVVGSAALRIRPGGGEDRGEGDGHVPAVPAAPRLGAHHPQVAGAHARPRLHRSRAGNLCARTGVCRFIAVPITRRSRPRAAAPAIGHPFRPVGDGLPRQIPAPLIAPGQCTKRKARLAGAHGIKL